VAASAGSTAAGGETCPTCGTERAAGVRFCTSCGHRFDAELDSGERTITALIETQPLRTVEPATAVVSPQRFAPAPTPSLPSRSWLTPLLAGVLAVMLVAFVVFAVLWQKERAAHQRDQRAAAAKIASLNTRIAGLQGQLADAQALSARQGALLRKATSVLATVDPLLSKADKLQQLTGNIQSNRDTFSTDAGTMIDDMVSLGNDLIDVAKFTTSTSAT